MTDNRLKNVYGQDHVIGDLIQTEKMDQDQKYERKHRTYFLLNKIVDKFQFFFFYSDTILLLDYIIFFLHSFLPLTI